MERVLTMLDPPVVSVIVPTFNRAGLLPLTIDSILVQTFRDIELIVVDDGSNDGTADYLAGIHDPRVRTINRSHCGNVAHVRNAGAAAARGRFLCFLDSDDLWLPHKLESQLDAIGQDEAAWCYTRYEHIDDRGNRIPARTGEWRGPSGNIARDVISTDASVSVVTVLMPRSVFEEMQGFDEDPRIREDHELLVRLAVAAKAVAIGECLALVREHPGRSTNAVQGAEPFLRSAATYDRLLARLDDPALREAARRRRAHLLAEAGAAHLSAGYSRRAAACFIESARGGATPRQLLSAVGRGLTGSMRAPHD